MKKFYLLFSFLLFAAITMQAQIFEENFDSFTAGEKLAQQAGLPWTTWSQTPGSAEDPYVSDAQSLTAPNSVNIGVGNDNILLLGDSVTGRYKISFSIYVPAGKVAFYDLLQLFAGANSSWGTQVFFDLGGQGRIDAGAEAAATFNFDYDTWIQVENYIDLDNDWAEVFIDGNYLIGWQWTLGSFGTPGPLQLAAINFYGWDVTGTPDFYYDDIVFEESPLGDAPQNLTADLNGHDVTLSWNTPATGDAFTYYTFRDNVLLGIDPDTTFSDYLDLPGTYEYTVKAMYLDNGLSAPAGPAEVIIDGGTDRNLVLVEIGTGTGCPYCPGSAMGADDLIVNGHDAAIIEYHSYNSSDPFNIPEAADRTSYYNITGYPTAWFDGGSDVVGGSHTVSSYSAYYPIVDDRITKPSWFELNIDVNNGFLPDDYTVEITANKIYDYAGTNMSIFLALTESNIAYSWQGMDQLDYVCRAMYPGSAGTPTTFNLNEPVVLDYTINVTYPIENCELVAFIQDVDTKEVMQTIKVNIADIVGINSIGEKYTKIYPNPATNNVTVQSGSNIKHISIYDVNGRKVYDVALDQDKVNINIESLNKGVYVINIDSDNGTKTEKLSVL